MKLALTPSPLHLFGGPHQQPLGTLEAIDADTGKPWSGPLEWSCSNPDWVFETDRARCTVGSYRAGSATVTARDSGSKQEARASVQVAIMDGGLPT